MFIDSHCHLQFKSFESIQKDMINRCIEAGCIMNTVGTHLDTSKAAVALAEAYPEIYASVGLHPIQSKKVGVTEEYTSFVARGEDFETEAYRTLIQSSSKVIGIGETGLDAYHIPKDMPLTQVMDDQWNLFMRHVELSEEFNLPLVIHIRNAHAEMIKRLKEYYSSGKQIRGVVHCYTGNWENAQQYLDMGLYLGFTGIVTFPPKKNNPKEQLDLLAVVDNIPLDKMLVETDAPFLAPQAHRGKQCEPWMTREVIQFIAERRGLNYDDLEKITVENTKRLFTNI